MNLRGHNCKVVKRTRCRKEDFPEKYLYAIRSSDFNENEPATIEKRVVVNFYGTLISDDEIDLTKYDGTESDPHIKLTNEERDIIRKAVF